MSVQHSVLLVFTAVWVGSMLTAWIAARRFRRHLDRVVSRQVLQSKEQHAFAALDRAYRSRLEQWVAGRREVTGAGWGEPGRLRLVFDDATEFAFDDAVLSVDREDLDMLVGATAVSTSVHAGVTAVLLVTDAGAVVAAGRLFAPDRLFTGP